MNYSAIRGIMVYLPFLILGVIAVFGASTANINAIDNSGERNTRIYRTVGKNIPAAVRSKMGLSIGLLFISAPGFLLVRCFRSQTLVQFDDNQTSGEIAVGYSYLGKANLKEFHNYFGKVSSTNYRLTFDPSLKLTDGSQLSSTNTSPILIRGGQKRVQEFCNTERTIPQSTE